MLRVPFWKNQLPVILFLVLFPLSEEHVWLEQWVSPTYSPTEGKTGVQQPIYRKKKKDDIYNG